MRETAALFQTRSVIRHPVALTSLCLLFGFASFQPPPLPYPHPPPPLFPSFLQAPSFTASIFCPQTSDGSRRRSARWLVGRLARWSSCARYDHSLTSRCVLQRPHSFCARGRVWQVVHAVSSSRSLFFAGLVTFHFRWEMRKGVAHISPLSLADNVRPLPHRFLTHSFESLSPRRARYCHARIRSYST